MHRLLHVIPSLAQGGAESLAKELIERTADQFHHTVVTLSDEGAGHYLKHTSVLSLGLSRGQATLGAVRQFREILRSSHFDLIQSWLYHGNCLSIFARDTGCPILWSIHNTDLPSCSTKRLTRVVDSACGLLSRWVPTAIVYCSEAAQLSHEQRGYFSLRGVVIDNGVDRERYVFNAEARRRVRADLGLPADGFVVGSIARFDPQKGHEDLIQAVGDLSRQESCFLVLAGRGCDYDNAELQINIAKAGLTDRVRLLGFREDVPSIMSALDVLAISSRFGEALPMVGLEAAATGLPVIATRVGTVSPFLLSEQHKIPIGDVRAMAAALAAVRAGVGTPAFSEMNEARLGRMVQFDIEACCNQYANLYEALIARRPIREFKQAIPPVCKRALHLGDGV